MNETTNADLIIGITREYFSGIHLPEYKETTDKLNELFESNPIAFQVVIFSICSRMGQEMPSFGTEMILTWIKGYPLNDKEIK